jgi:DNA-binding NarL/FixJ family response regulator
MPQPTVLLVDDLLMIRQGCRRILEQHKDVTVVGEAISGKETLKKIEELKPHVVLMDLNLPGISGIDVTRRALARAANSVSMTLRTYTSPAVSFSPRRGEKG